MYKIMIVFLMALVTSANAEVFKCNLTEKIVYQSVPCPPDATKQQLLDAIQQTPADKVAEAEQRLSTWKSELAAREVAEQKAKKERQDALDKQATIDALKRSAEAQEALAEAVRQPPIINSPPVYIRQPLHFRGRPGDRPRQYRDPDGRAPGRNSRDPVNTSPSGWVTPTH
ncbi:MAG: hypothetical protein PHR16_12475 [Methylovulum sp.]|nr:hypothetical protein [Methylovulum sp.]